MRYDMKKIMSRAWSIKKENNRYVFSECLKLAWEEMKIEMLYEEITELKGEVIRRERNYCRCMDLKNTNKDNEDRANYWNKRMNEERNEYRNTLEVLHKKEWELIRLNKKISQMKIA